MYTQEEKEIMDKIATSAISACTSSQKPKNLWQWIKWATGNGYQSIMPDEKDMARNAYTIAKAIIEERRKINQ